MATPEKNKVPFVSATADGDDVQITIRGEMDSCVALAAALFATVLKSSLPAPPNAILASAGEDALKVALDYTDKVEHIAIDMAAIERGTQPS